MVLYLLVQLPHQTIFHLFATFLNVLVVVSLPFSSLYCVPETSGVLLDYPPKYSKLSLIGVFMALPAIAKVLLGLHSL